MTKKELLLALQKFPDDTPVQIRVASGAERAIDGVQWVVDATPQAVDPSFDSWQASVAGRLRLILVAGVSEVKP